MSIVASPQKPFRSGGPACPFAGKERAVRFFAKLRSRGMNESPPLSR